MIEEHYRLVSIDLFSGPGGLCTGFKWAGIFPLIAVEWTDSTVLTYKKNHNAEEITLSDYTDGNGEYQEDALIEYMHESTRPVIIHGDINLVRSETIKHLLAARYGIDSETETVDIVSGGAPCESFSMAGTRTVGDARDDLFSNIIRIAKDVQSKTILFENVKGLFSKPDARGRRGAIFEYICNSFEREDENLPTYHLASRRQEDILLTASDYGVPQARERLFLVSIRNDLTNIQFTYPEKTNGPDRQYPFVTVRDAIKDLPEVGMGEGGDSIEYNFDGRYHSENQRRFVSIMRGDYDDEGIYSHVPEHLISNHTYTSDHISFHKGPGHVKRKQELLALIQPESSMRATYERLEAEGTLQQYRHLFPQTIYGSRNRRLIWDEPSFTVTSHCLDEILHPVLNRAITPREAARLQSFPDWYQFEGPYVQFHGDREQDKYEQIGDAIPPLLANAMGRQFVRCLPNHLENI